MNAPILRLEFILIYAMTSFVELFTQLTRVQLLLKPFRPSITIQDKGGGVRGLFNLTIPSYFQASLSLIKLFQVAPCMDQLSDWYIVHRSYTRTRTGYGRDMSDWYVWISPHFSTGSISTLPVLFPPTKTSPLELYACFCGEAKLGKCRNIAEDSDDRHRPFFSHLFKLTDICWFHTQIF